MPVALTGPQRGELAEILIDAFPEPNQFRNLLSYRLNMSLAKLAAPGDYDSVMFEVLQKAAAQWWIGDLLLATRAENPRHPGLAAFAAQYGAAVAMPAASPLQLVIQESNSFLDVAMWRSRLGEIEARVCRVEVDLPEGTAFGTGFLIGPDAILTNYHVVEDVIAKLVSPERLRFRFDYKVIDGKARPGRVHLPAAGDGWLIDSSRFSDADLAAYTPDRSPSVDELDYAVVRLAERVGEMTIGEGTPDAPKRGWIPAAEPMTTLAPKGTMHILQHPNAEPMKLALGASAVIGLNANATRVRYTTNTLGGSSGSPCFDQDWELLALHHSGDPRFPHLTRPEYNQGIPITAIVQRLRRNEKLAKLA